ncbi:MAG TPA: nucleotidyltransferase domain-containing protein [Anaerolineae bacterium]|nr:nucleotidyltransferase domain-containing protein [Anaerolineae bacterium]
MVLTADQVRTQILRFVEALQQRMRVERAVLFGSYAYGKPHEGSDIDLAIVSPDFAAMNRLERLVFLERIAWDADAHYIEPVGFTAEELQNASRTSVLSEIRDRGVVIRLDEASVEPLVVRDDRADYSVEEDGDA